MLHCHCNRSTNSTFYLQWEQFPLSSFHFYPGISLCVLTTNSFDTYSLLNQCFYNETERESARKLRANHLTGHAIIQLLFTHSNASSIMDRQICSSFSVSIFVIYHVHVYGQSQSNFRANTIGWLADWMTLWKSPCPSQSCSCSWCSCCT